MIPHNPSIAPVGGVVIPFPSVAPQANRKPFWSAIPWRTVLFGMERVLDFLTAFVAAVISIAVGRIALGENLGLPPFVAGATYAATFVFLLDKEREYQPSVSLLAIRETERWLRAAFQCIALAAPVLYILTGLFHLALVLACASLTGILLAAQKCAVRKLSRMAAASGLGMRRTLIVGAGPLAQKVYSVLRRSPKFGLDPVALVDENAAFSTAAIHEFGYSVSDPAQIFAGPVSRRLLRNLEISAIVIADPELPQPEQLEVAAEVADLGVQTYIAERDFAEPDLLFHHTEVDGVPLHEVLTETFSTSGLSKRVFDAMTGAAALLVLSPIILAITLAVWFTSEGPVLFRQKRVGQGGRLFTIYKFRTMQPGPPLAVCGPKDGDDARVTRLGKFLRKTSLDELPQLLNVVRGEMSLVGPRPETLERDRFYSGIARRRFELKPGLTGMWQLSAARNLPIFENIEYDLYYERHRNFFMDVAILMHTVAFVAKGL